MKSVSRLGVTALVAMGATVALTGCGGGDSGGGSATPTASGPNGKDIYMTRCQTCHGDLGRGDGPGAIALPVKPRDLTSEKYKYVDIPGHDTEIDALVDYIKVGRQENGMPPFEGQMSEAEFEAVAKFVAGIRPEPNYVEEHDPAGGDAGGGGEGGGEAGGEG